MTIADGGGYQVESRRYSKFGAFPPRLAMAIEFELVASPMMKC